MAHMKNIIGTLPRLTWSIAKVLNSRHTTFGHEAACKSFNVILRPSSSSFANNYALNESMKVDINCRKQFGIHLAPLPSAVSQKQFHTCVHRFTEKREKIASQRRKHQGDDAEVVLETSQETIHEYSELLDCRVEAVEAMVRYNPRLVAPERQEDVIAKIRLLRNAGFTGQEIVTRCQVFRYSMSFLMTRLATMQAVKLYRFRIAHLFLQKEKFQSRMSGYRKEVELLRHHPNQKSFVAELLECSQDEVMELSKQVLGDFLLSFPPSRLLEAMKILLSYGVPKSLVREKILMLRIPPDTIRKRLKRMVDNGVLEVNRVPSALYNNDTHFEDSMASWLRNTKALEGFADERELLQTRLQCTDAQISDLFYRKPNVARLRSAKLKSCLDILQSEIGVSPASILVYGDLLHFSPQRLRNRWLLLQQLGLSEQALIKDLLLTEDQFVAKYGFESK